MGMERRRFLKVAGFSLLGFAGLPDSLSGGLSKAGASSRKKGRDANRWAMVVDLRGAGSNAAGKIACHRVHNVPDFGNHKDEIKWIWEEPFVKAFPGQEQQHLEEGLRRARVLVLCNHCDNPPCVRVCPTQATFKRRDGIVMMDYHRCIGCRYCMAACPFGARSFNWRDPRPAIFEITPGYPTRTKGVVEKCNFCVERLVRGLPPACVEALPRGRLVFGDAADPESEVRELLRKHFTIRRKPFLGTDPQVFYIV